MNLQIDANANRLPFLDNLRSLMVALVLVFHAGASYTSAASFWPFHESRSSGLIDIYMFLGDVFFMSILFFVAGYFTVPSVTRFTKRTGLSRCWTEYGRRCGTIPD